MTTLALPKPALHPNGFIITALNPESTLRFHVWPEVPFADSAEEYTIHDHVWDMESTVLLGELHHKVREVVINSDPAGVDWEVWQATDHCRNGRAAARQGGSVVEKRTNVWGHEVFSHVTVLRAGDRYTFPRRQFHTTGHSGLTATLIRKVTRDDPGQPIVLCRPGKSPDDIFNADVDERQLRGEVDKALDAMSPWALRELEALL